MQRAIWVLVFVAALAGAFLLGRWTAQPSPEDQRVGATNDLAAASESSSAGRSPAASPAGSRDLAFGSGSNPANTAHGATAGSSGTAAATAVDARNGVAIGPQPWRQEDVLKVAKALDGLRAEGGVWRDLLDLSDRDGRDEEARMLEQQIAQRILQHGGHLTRLRLAPPHCTQSVCRMQGVGAGGNDPASDWQMLSMKLMNEPWFRTHFDDMRSSYSVDGGEPVYVTLFVRCKPNACRFANR